VVAATTQGGEGLCRSFLVVVMQWVQGVADNAALSIDMRSEHRYLRRANHVDLRAGGIHVDDLSETNKLIR
jgi:hypothetical protein